MLRVVIILIAFLPSSITSQIKYVDLSLTAFNYQPQQLEENTYFKTMNYYT